MSKSEALFNRRKAVVPQGVGIFNTVTVDHASGSTLTDVDGRDFIDFGGGIGVLNAGYCPEPVVEAIQQQAAKLIHSCFHVATYEPYVELCEKMVEILPHGKSTKVMLTNTGAESVENAIKIARQATGRQAVLCYTGAFHGRSMMAMTLTSKINYKVNCGPFAPEVYRLPFPNVYRYSSGMSEAQFVEQELKRLRESAHNLVNPQSVAAIIMEFVQGEGGFNTAPQAYVQGLREFCDEHGILLIADEVQSGFARTGKWAAWQHYGITPDISTYAKSMGSGMPIGAVMGKAEIMDKAAPGTIGGTYLGNPVCCASALATIAYMKEVNLNARAVEVGDKIRQRFEAIKSQCPQVGDVRGLGAMIAMEFVKNGDPRQPDGDICARISQRCREEGLIVLSAGTFKNIIRVLGPLTATDEELDRGLDILESAIYAMTEAVPA